MSIFIQNYLINDVFDGATATHKLWFIIYESGKAVPMWTVDNEVILTANNALNI